MCNSGSLADHVRPARRKPTAVAVSRLEGESATTTLSMIADATVRQRTLNRAVSEDLGPLNRSIAEASRLRIKPGNRDSPYASGAPRILYPILYPSHRKCRPIEGIWGVSGIFSRADSSSVGQRDRHRSLIINEISGQVPSITQPPFRDSKAGLSNWPPSRQTSPAQPVSH